MFELEFWLLSIPVFLIPSVFFLLGAYRVCKKRQLNPFLWLSFIFVCPPLGLASLYSSIQPEEKKKNVFIRVFLTALVLTLLFYYIAYLLETA